jgi:hypothetical protein
MIKRTFLDKTNTIFENSNENFGLHPISMLNYGLEKSRILLHFDINEIQEFINSCPEGSDIKHILKMTNCGSVDFKNFNKKISSYDMNGVKSRAVSFTIYAFPIKNDMSDGYISWDEGVGFDSNADFFVSGKSSVSTEGSNWFNRKSGLKWIEKGCIGENPNINDIIAYQHFDHGNENLELDITEYINSLLSADTSNEWSANNDGLCLTIEPHLDGEYDREFTETFYVGFFNNKTNTFFVPCVESRCEECIEDNRYNFKIGKNNKLFLYVETDNGFTDTDNIPTCTIGECICEQELEVKRFSKGIYYVDISSGISSTFMNDSINYDIWSNISIEGVPYDNLEMEFVANRNILGGKKEINYEPSLHGINDNECLLDGEIRKVSVKYRIPYSSKYDVLENTEYRIYTKDSNREIEVVSWDKIHSAGMDNYFLLNTSEYVCGKYYVDIRIKSKYQQRVHKNVLCFTKVNNITNIVH